jgi:NTP pyrophosphatase (non-canonical NTP hydrolase)
MNVREMQELVHRGAVEHGFWDTDRNRSEMMMLIVSEIGEACEALRHGDPPSDHIPRHSGVAEEMADAVIRILDYCGGTGIDLEQVILDKMAFNQGRERLHGKKF